MHSRREKRRGRISRSLHAFQTIKKKARKKKVKKGLVEPDLLPRTNLDNGIEQKGVSTMEYQVLYPRAAPIFDQYLFSENPKLD